MRSIWKRGALSLDGRRQFASVALAPSTCAGTISEECRLEEWAELICPSRICAQLQRTRTLVALTRASGRQSTKYRLRQQRRHDIVRHVHNIGDAKIHSDAADDVSLFFAKSALLEQCHHVEGRIAAGESSDSRLRSLHLR